MSSTMENRAAVFTSEPQAVEVYQAGAWWSGELLGWRHAGDGSCQVWVRVVLDGVEETAWTDLETLRLPERHLAMAPEPGKARTGDRELSVARHPSSRREHRADAGSPTESMPVVRDLSVVPDATVPPAGGRRRAPDVPAPASSGGRRRAPDVPAPASSGGRRRAPELPAPAAPGGRRRAPEDAASATGPAALLGRHGAMAPAVPPATPGRHRTADTGLIPAVPAATAAREDVGRSAGPATVGRSPAVLGVRAAEPGGPERGRADWSSPGGADPERLTRTMRLSDRAPHSRRPRPDRSRPSV